MGNVDKIRGLDGKDYTVSTTKKFDTWETAVFQGSGLGTMFGKRPCLAEVVLGDQPEEALLVHQRAAGLVAIVPRAHWEMSRAEIRQQQEPAVQYVIAKGNDKEMIQSLPSPTLRAIVQSDAYGPGTSLLMDWLEQLSELRVDKGWGAILSAATQDRSWSDPTAFAEAARIVEADPAVRAGITYASGAVGVTAARSGATDGEANVMMAIGRNAAVALLVRHTLRTEIFETLYAPFAQEVPAPGEPLGLGEPGPSLVDTESVNSMRNQPQRRANPEVQSGPPYAATSPQADPLERYAAEIVRSARELASDLVVAKDADDLVELEVATEICYYLLQMAQRQVGAFLTHAQMSDVIPRLTFRVFDDFAGVYGIADTALSAADLEEFRADWINNGADRNDFYGQCRLSAGESESMVGDLNWEAAKIIVKTASADLIQQMTLSVTLPVAAFAMIREDLMSAANQTPA